MKKSHVCFILTAVLLAMASGQYIEATITVGSGPTAMVYDSVNRKVFVANNGSNNVSVINATSNSVVATVAVGDKPVAMCWSRTSNKVYVVCAPYTGTGSIYVINAATNGVVTSIDVGTSPVAIVWCSEGNKVYCLNPGSSSISVANCADDQLLTTISIPDQTPVDLAYNPSNDHVYFTSTVISGSGKVRAINCSTEEIVATVIAGSNPGTLAVNPVGNRVYANNKGSNNVTVVNGATNQNLGRVTVLQEPTPLLWTPQNKVFVGEYWSNSVAFMHGDSLRIRGRVTVPGNPRTLVYVPNTQKVFCTNLLAGKVSLLDARDDHERIVTNLNVGGGPLAMVVYPDQDRVFVANSWENTVTAIKDIVGVEEAGGPMLADSREAFLRPSPARVGQVVRLGCGAEPLDVRDAAGRVVAAAAHSWVPRSSGVYFVSYPGSRSAGKLVVE